MKHCTLALALVLTLLVGCKAAPKAPPGVAAEPAAGERPPPDLQALLAACSPSGEKPWTRARCEAKNHDCWTQGGASCPRGSVEVEGLKTETSSTGEVWVSGVLVCKEKRSRIQSLLVASESSSDQAPRRKLGGLEIKWQSEEPGRAGPGAPEPWPQADPLPLVEDFRTPFRINLSTSGIPLERTEKGRTRASLFGLGSSEEGPSFMLLVKFEF
ncbi:MAG: hypothetical protein JKY65_31240 [Planctomycetes bacterium]|nr:hypothetical protein [Planctomycetota bacterium]